MFTLEQIAHFDRCLFSNSLRADLEAIGAPEDVVFGVWSFVRGVQHREQRTPGIVEIYQEFIMSPEVTGALTALLSAHVVRYP